MPLTPQDVSTKVFTTVRLREGYDMGEVDQFLDEVETELARLVAENDELRRASGQAPAAPAAPVQPSEPVAAEPAPAVPVAVQDGVRPAVETLQVTTTADASNAAARLLEIATRNAEELEAGARTDAASIRSQAQAEADQLTSQSREEAERLTSQTRQEAEKLEAEARRRAQLVNSEADEKRAQLLGRLEVEKQQLDAEVENLRSFEREYRSRLRSYFEQQLEALGLGEGGVGDETSPRVTSLLSDEDDDTP